MNQSPYSFTIHNHSLRFDFVSTGKRLVSKSVIYTPTGTPQVYTLALVDVYPDGSADDTSVTDNGDMEKILRTVYETLALFFHNHSNVIVTFTGSTPARTRLYRMALTHELSTIVLSYNVWGLLENSYEMFMKDRAYIGFLLSPKGINIV